MSRRDEFKQVAEETPFDNDTNGFVSDDVQGAIEELQNDAAISASPGFGWGKGGSAGPGEYLYNESVESNKVGRLVPFDGYIFRFFFIEQKKSGTRTLDAKARVSFGNRGFGLPWQALFLGGEKKQQ